MSELERRLRDALHGASELPPPGLIDAVRRRHRRFQLRVGASLVAVVAAAAIGVPQLAGALQHGPAAGRGTHGPAPTTGHHWRTTEPVPHPRASAAPGTVLVGCGSGPNAGQLSRLSDYPSSGRSLPLRFLDGGHSHGRIKLYVAIAVLKDLRPGTAVVVTVPRAYRGDLRFLYADSLLPGTKYTMRSGEAGVTFVACSASQETFPSPGMTDYYGAYIVRGTRCVPVNVRIPARRQAGVIRLGACQGR